ncbi:MAG: hypothetical protein B6D64_13395 [Bacteroidetes bacterium 4484_276]|nr:MAG: hypothetical protein B6D64_13395 [Bacteroidetes bacterium 4484_276]OYT13819.1 MAG: hypothetical protein B6I19_03185 [Bacteroidetes bacterium 4572_114]
MKNIFRNLSLLLTIAMMAYSCTERIDIDLDQQEYARIVVEGAISTDTTAHLITLTKTADYFENQPPTPVTNAEVFIFNDEEEYQLTEKPANSGRYFTESNVYGTTGREYEMKILLDEQIGGEMEYHATSTIYPINQVDSIVLEFHEDWGDEGYWEVKCYVWDPPTTDFYMFYVYRNGEPCNDTITEVFVVDDLMYNGNFTNGIGVAFLNQAYDHQKLRPGDTVTLRVSRITKEYTDFLLDVQEEVNFSTPLFSGPPANVKGNIDKGGFGAFTAYSNSYASAVVE